MWLGSVACPGGCAPGPRARAGGKAGVLGCFRDLWPVVPWVFLGRMERLRAEGTSRSVTPELEKSVVTWISLQSSTQLTFNLLGAAWGVHSRCLYGARATQSSRVSQRGKKEAAVVPRPSGSREPSDGLQTLPPIRRGWRSHLHLEESPQILSFLLEC